jgi:hypothetical protein
MMLLLVQFFLGNLLLILIFKQKYELKKLMFLFIYGHLTEFVSYLYNFVHIMSCGLRVAASSTTKTITTDL